MDEIFPLHSLLEWGFSDAWLSYWRFTGNLIHQIYSTRIISPAEIQKKINEQKLAWTHNFEMKSKVMVEVERTSTGFCCAKEYEILRHLLKKKGKLWDDDSYEPSRMSRKEVYVNYLKKPADFCGRRREHFGLLFC